MLTVNSRFSPILNVRNTKTLLVCCVVEQADAFVIILEELQLRARGFVCSLK
jgi:hypothetical protein